jgi:hypothetical protein
MDYRAADESRKLLVKLESPFRAIMVKLRLIDGELMLGWPNIDQPVVKLTAAHWRGPIPPSSEPGSW